MGYDEARDHVSEGFARYYVSEPQSEEDGLVTLCPECAVEMYDEDEISEHAVNLDEPAECEVCGEFPPEGEPSEPSEEDYVIFDSGPLGSRTSVRVVGGRILGEFRDHDDAEEAIRRDMESGEFYPDVWTLSDHGNYHRTEV